MGLTEKMELDLTPKTAETLFEGDGGSYYVWSSSQMPVLASANVGAGRLVLKPQGFALPHYADSSKVAYVIQGQSLPFVLLRSTDTSWIRRASLSDTHRVRHRHIITMNYVIINGVDVSVSVSCSVSVLCFIL
jgi:hypothetical protein